MSRRGAWELQKLSIAYCDFGGSSRGVREFLSSWLNRFQEENSHLVVEEVVRRGQHPSIIGFYANGNIRAVDLKNKDSGEILRQAALLRSSAGRKSTVQVKDRLQTKLPSVQGRWNSALQDKLSSSQ